MNYQNLLKGFEVELFTGSLNCEHIGVASNIVNQLSNFEKEPDQRNIEYITSPAYKYEELKPEILLPRHYLRQWLEDKNLTIIPGSTMSLDSSNSFQRSDPSNNYHEFIELNYGTDVVTTSIHINLGIPDLSKLFAAVRLVRCEAALFLALSASSPFLNGGNKGVHSQRWIQFPSTPNNVPFFLDYSHYVQWIEEQLEQGIMFNERHLWCSVRPNGPRKPYELNRLELRICDLITDCDLLLAITALLELRVISLISGDLQLDPLEYSQLSMNELIHLSNHNDLNAARFSLNATLKHWKDGKAISCREWIQSIIEEVKPIATKLNMLALLDPITSTLKNGNQSMKWLQSYSEGQSLKQILQHTMSEMVLEESLFLENEAMMRR